MKIHSALGKSFGEQMNNESNKGGWVQAAVLIFILFGLMALVALKIHNMATNEEFQQRKIDTACSIPRFEETSFCLERLAKKLTYSQKNKIEKDLAIAEGEIDKARKKINRLEKEKELLNPIEGKENQLVEMWVNINNEARERVKTNHYVNLAIAYLIGVLSSLIASFIIGEKKMLDCEGVEQRICLTRRSFGRKLRCASFAPHSLVVINDLQMTAWSMIGRIGSKKYGSGGDRYDRLLSTPVIERSCQNQLSTIASFHHTKFAHFEEIHSIY